MFQTTPYLRRMRSLRINPVPIHPRAVRVPGEKGTMFRMTMHRNDLIAMIQVDHQGQEGGSHPSSEHQSGSDSLEAVLETRGSGGPLGPMVENQEGLDYGDVVHSLHHLIE